MGGQAQLDEAGRRAEGHLEQAGRFAGEDLAAGVALELEGPPGRRSPLTGMTSA
jgi:hypothetical protein